MGWMIGDLEIDPFNSDRMMYGTGATIYGTNNLGDWDTGGKVNISVMAKGVEETAVLGLISPPSGAHLITALGDVSGFRYDDVTAVPVKFQTSPIWGEHEQHRLCRAGPGLCRSCRRCGQREVSEQ